MKLDNDTTKQGAAYRHFLNTGNCLQCESSDTEETKYNDGRAERVEIVCCDCGLIILEDFA